MWTCIGSTSFSEYVLVTVLEQIRFRLFNRNPHIKEVNINLTNKYKILIFELKFERFLNSYKKTEKLCLRFWIIIKETFAILKVI